MDAFKDMCSNNRYLKNSCIYFSEKRKEKKRKYNLIVYILLHLGEKLDPF